jgi:hypothetical protein
MSGKDNTLFIIYHPEIIFFKNQIFNNYVFDFLVDVNITAIQYLESESLLSPIILFPQLLFIIYLGFFFVAFFFSFYSSSTKEESTIDSDYLSSSLVVESEKELGSVDDMIMPSIILIYTCSWYFYIHALIFFSTSPELTLTVFFLPLIFYTISFAPTFLVHDFGIIYNCYLKGIVPSTSLIIELTYDYISVICFYIRVLTQAIRLALMFIVYVSMHDLVIETYYYNQLFNGTESIWEELSNLDASVPSITYFLVCVLPTIINNWLFEIIHTFFVITGQLIAYIGMIF